MHIVYVCMCVYVRMCIYLGGYICVYMCAHVYVHICVCVFEKSIHASIQVDDSPQIATRADLFLEGHLAMLLGVSLKIVSRP